MESDKKILVIAPHPDDEIIGCGGFLLNRKKSHKIYIVYITSGAFNYFYQDELIKNKRIKETNQVCNNINAKAIYLDEDDRFIINNQKTVQKVVDVLNEIQPDIILLPHKNEADSDHKIVSEIATKSIFIAAKLSKINKWSPEFILGYEVWTPIQEFNYVENITTVIKDKTNLINLYLSQKDFDFSYAIEGLNRYRGATTQKGTYCEIFKVYTLSEVE